MIPHKQPDILADFRAADLGFGVAIAVNQDTEQEDAGNRPGQHQHPVQVKLSRPQKLHDRVKQQEQAAGEQALQNSSPNANIKIFVLFQDIVFSHSPRPPSN